MFCGEGGGPEVILFILKACQLSAKFLREARPSA